MEKNWGNTMLVACSSVAKICAKVEKQLESRINRGFQSRHFRDGENTYEFLEKFKELTDEKRRLCNIAAIVRSAFSKMRSEDAEILRLRYLEKHTFQQITADLSLSLRTVFRRIERAEASYSVAMRALGFTDEFLAKEYSADPYIRPLYDRIQSETYTTATNL